MTWLPDTVRWYGTLLLITLAFAPLARWLCGRLPGQGATVARPLGMLAVIWPTWFLASVTPLPFSTAGLWLTLLVGGVAGWGYAWRKGWVTREWLVGLAVIEALTLIVFLGYVGLRGYTPRITGTEKPMDIALLSASAHTTELPPRDPWFAGETINYYYLGYFVHGSVARMAGVPTWVAFNLALATTVAMTIAGAAGVAFAVGRRVLGRRGALGVATLAAFLVGIAGNLRAPIRFLQDPRASINSDWWHRIGWPSSRIVVDHGSSQDHTINEFPWFSFLLGDLHPHVTTLPFTLLALSLAVGLLWGQWREHKDDASTWARLIVAGMALGALYPLNSWDFPTYLVIALAALVFASGPTRDMLKRVGVLVWAALVAWLPFTVSFVPFAGGNKEDLSSALRDLPLISRSLTTVGVFDGERTNTGEFLTVFGIAWTAAVAYLVVEVVRARGGEPSPPAATQRVPGPMLGEGSVAFERPPLPALGEGGRGVRAGGEGSQRPRVSGGAIVAVMIILFAALALPAPVLILAGAPFAAAVWLLWRSWGKEADARTIVAGLFAAGFALILITEFFFIQDVFGGRYNTLFKVYYQVWTLLGIGAALAVGLLWREAGAAINRVAPRAVLAGGVAVAIVAGLVYPILATEQWTDWAGPREWQGLDGLDFVEETAPGDVATIHWLADHAKKDDVVLEAPGCQYHINFGEPTSRISGFTGVPTVIGWDGAEGQWRNGQPELLRQIRAGSRDPRAEDVAAMYADPQSDLFDRYKITLLYVGKFERDGTGDDCLKAGPFPAVDSPGYPGEGWTAVFASDEGVLYRRTG